MTKTKSYTAEKMSGSGIESDTKQKLGEALLQQGQVDETRNSFL
jgi:hypothetical protein